jgi:hypothetical protein
MISSDQLYSGHCVGYQETHLLEAVILIKITLFCQPQRSQTFQVQNKSRSNINYLSSCLWLFQDPRLAGGYENVPTVDIHMNQIGYDRHWLHFLQQFIMPVQQKIFIGYFHDVRLCYIIAD